MHLTVDPAGPKLWPSIKHGHTCSFVFDPEVSFVATNFDAGVGEKNPRL